MGQVAVPGEVGMDADLGRALLDLGQFGQPRGQAVLVADHAGVLGHRRTQRPLQGPDVLRAVGAEQSVELRPVN